MSSSATNFATTSSASVFLSRAELALDVATATVRSPCAPTTNSVEGVPSTSLMAVASALVVAIPSCLAASPSPQGELSTPSSAPMARTCCEDALVGSLTSKTAVAVSASGCSCARAGKTTTQTRSRAVGPPSASSRSTTPLEPLSIKRLPGSIATPRASVVRASASQTLKTSVWSSSKSTTSASQFHSGAREFLQVSVRARSPLRPSTSTVQYGSERPFQSASCRPHALRMLTLRVTTVRLFLCTGESTILDEVHARHFLASPSRNRS
mmetsp:Transcript_91650/g.258767  ORF Transcript_91650/g.258767 Transcript_91650/m.258767 type:complete len:268 (+) Transcript_91650:3823-4626(+)